MKNKFIIFFCSLVASNAGAFQAKISLNGLNDHGKTSSLESHFYGFHEMDAQNIHPGTCGAKPISGCQCSYCTQLRNSSN
ncbi:hypothetical protein [Pantoea sp. GbtcB22]|jgi:hypothetical protein|uniref:hypothetical protein n=1 Tax=Pantoea sp. GbtcB22 TaxID=2824767 RepID=UPI001C2F5973|nr:hypothetical protein [Pantoea sp. GbtcB22]